MRFHKLTFFAGLFLTVVMLLVSLLFDYSHTIKDSFDRDFLYSIIGAFVFMLVVNYAVLDLLFNYYGKRQIRKMSDFLPDDLVTQEKVVSFQQLGERITSIAEQNATEVGFLKEMEIYRKEY